MGGVLFEVRREMEIDCVGIAKDLYWQSMISDVLGMDICYAKNMLYFYFPVAILSTEHNIFHLF